MVPIISAERPMPPPRFRRGGTLSQAELQSPETKSIAQRPHRLTPPQPRLTPPVVRLRRCQGKRRISNDLGDRSDSVPLPPNPQNPWAISWLKRGSTPCPHCQSLPDRGVRRLVSRLLENRPRDTALWQCGLKCFNPSICHRCIIDRERAQRLQVHQLEETGVSDSGH